MASYKAPSAPCTKYNMTARVTELERVICSADAAIRELTARFDRLPPRGEQGPTGPMGLQGKAGEPGQDGKDSTIAGPAGASMIGPRGEKGEKGLRGEAGRSGRDGTNGKDSTVAGPKGDKGDTGAVLVLSDSELAAELHNIRALRAQSYAKLIDFIVNNDRAPRGHARSMMKIHLEELKRMMSVGVCEEDVKKYR